MGIDNRGAGTTGSTVPLGDNSEVVDIVAQAQSRPDGFDYGDDRAIGDRPNWYAQDSQQLYSFATVNNEPGSAEEIGQQWSSHSASLQQAADDLYNAIAELGAAWIGQGAGAAQGSLVAIANSSSQASEAANTMSSRLAQQASAAAELKKMPQPVEFDPGAQTAAMLADGPAAMVKDMKPQFDAAQDVKAQQVAYLEAYTTAMSEVDSTTPSFGPESLGLKPLTIGSGHNAGQVGSLGSYGVGFGTPGGTLAGIGAAPGIVTQGVDNSVVSSGYAAGGQAVSPAAAAHNAPAAAAAPAPGTGMGTGTGVGSAAVAPAPSSGPNVAGSLGAAVAGGALGYAGARSLGRGNRTGSTKQSSSETAATANQQGGSAASVQPQNQSMVPSSGTIGGANAVPPGAPMGGMGAGAARQEEEKEHTHASFLIDPDPDETFGATQATAPPVLGAWGPDDEER
ncbi:hypothetical protein ABZ863_12045 [Saccharomonospora sp. NPDC046836]|uniref:WXG100 family type VII secretion target n=1 Tax=Saccharomonospora sp. NPDC046836 TaxID=3156921 RepID=UPI0033D82283